MKTLQIINTIHLNSWGGTETVIAETSKGLIAQGHPTTIYASRRAHSVSSTEIDGVPLKQVSLLPYYFPEKNVDIIHWHQGMRLSRLVQLYCRKQDIPYVISLHNGDAWIRWCKQVSENKYDLSTIEGWRQRNLNHLFDNVIKNASAFFSVNLDGVDATKEFYPSKAIYYTPNGVNSFRFANGNGVKFREKHGISQNAFLLLCVGRITRQKNQIFTVQALKELHKVAPEVHVCFVGVIEFPDYYDQVMAKIRELELEGYVHFVYGLNGLSSDVSDAYHAGDVFILPSLWEGFPVTILEAWASSKPVLASRVNGIPYFVEHEKDGLLFQAGDVQDFVRSVTTLHNNSEYRNKLGQAGYEKVLKNYDWDELVKRQVKLYHDIIAEHQAKSIYECKI
jgi:glycosyltransferase involved in cell wall biosynthesis